MKKYSLLILTAFYFSPFVLQSQVIKQDSLALVALYHSLNGGEAGLNWLDGPIEGWGDFPGEIVLSTIPGEAVDEVMKVVTGIDLSRKCLTGVVPSEINHFEYLLQLNVAHNQIQRLPNVLSIKRLKSLNVSNNQLEALPTIDILQMQSLQTIDCSHNRLKFEDIVPLIKIPENCIYAPQADLPLFVYARDPGDHLKMDAYEEHDALPNNTYAWSKDDRAIGNDQYLIIETVELQDGGNYFLKVRNELAPDLTIAAPSYLRTPAGADPYSLISEHPDAENASIMVRTCPCVEEELPLYLWDGMNGWVESDTSRMGSGSGPDKDNIALNFEIPFEPQLEAYYCDYSNENTPAAFAGHYPLRTAIIGTGIAQHNDLLPFLAREQSAGDDACFAPGELLSFDFSNPGQGPFMLTDPHESHVAGIMTKNIPANVKLEVVDAKIFNQEAHLFDLICAIYFSIEKGAKVINLSLGYDHIEPSIFLYRAMKKAEEKGVLVVVSAGNKGKNNDEIDRWPGNFGVPTSYKGEHLPPLTNIIVVAALNAAQDGLAPFSNFGAETVDIAAAGTSILSTVVNENGESDYTIMSGTSMAAPEVSRAAAILMAYQPDASPAKIIEALMSSSIPLATDVQEHFSRRLHLLGAARYLQLPSDIIAPLEADSIYYASGTLIDETYPTQSIPHQAYHVLDNYELQLSPDNRNFRNIEFRVKYRKKGFSHNGEKVVVVYESNCDFGNKIQWDGIWNRVVPGTISDLTEGQYFVEVKVNGKSISVQPPKIMFKSGGDN